MMTTDQRAELDAAMAKATKAFPVTSRETPDYAEITFGSSQTQAMSMEPDTLLALNRVFEAAPLLTATIDAQAAEIARLREAYSEAVSVLGLHTQYGCPVCPGDCSSANPPMMNCPTDAAKRVFGRFDAALASNGAA